MIQRVALYFVLPMCILAFFLSLAGIQQIQFGDTYYTFLANVGKSYSQWAFEIPSIPKIPKLSGGDYEKSGLILAVLIKVANFFVNLTNGIVSILNILITILNVVIQVIQFILTIIYQCKDFIGRVSEVAVL